MYRLNENLKSYCWPETKAKQMKQAVLVLAKYGYFWLNWSRNRQHQLTRDERKWCENYNEKWCRVLGSVCQMWKCFSRVSVSAQTLCKTKPCWHHCDQRSNQIRALDARIHFCRWCCMPIVVIPIETNHELQIKTCRHQTVQLIGHPKIGKADIVEWRQANAPQHFQRPKSGLMTKCFRRIQQEHGHQNVQRERTHVHGNR